MKYAALCSPRSIPCDRSWIASRDGACLVPAPLRARCARAPRVRRPSWPRRRLTYNGKATRSILDSSLCARPLARLLLTLPSVPYLACRDGTAVLIYLSFIARGGGRLSDWLLLLGSCDPLAYALASLHAHARRPSHGLHVPCARCNMRR